MQIQHHVLTGDDFDAFLQAMRGRCLLHLGHKDADCDALASAYAVSRLLPGDLGFAGAMKAAAQDLAKWLSLEVQIDPDPAQYDYVIIYDTIKLEVLGLPLPARYALFDHHEPGGHRFADFHSELADGAEWAFVRPVESTCSLLVDLFQENGIELDQKMAVALAAGIITDTIWLRQADATALVRLASLLAVAGFHVEDVLAVIDSPHRKARRRSVVLEAIRQAVEKECAGWSILTSKVHSQDHGLVVGDVLRDLGSDISVVGFPQGQGSMVMIECSAVVVERAGFDAAGLMRRLAAKVGATESWGTMIFGRIIAPTPLDELLAFCLDEIDAALASG